MRFSITIDLKQKHPVILLKDSLTNCEAEIYSFGALLNKFTVPVNGKPINIIDGYSSVNDAADNIINGFRSAKLSPFTCRMNVGEYSFHERKYKIEKHYILPHAIHGIIFDAAYEVLATHADDTQASVGLRYHYRGTDNGYPFPYEILVNWKLEKDNRLCVKTTVLHHNQEAIFYADGWHPYFTLGTKVNECNLQFSSNTQIEFDETLIPTGKKTEDKRFENGAVLNDTFLDNCFELKGDDAKCVLSNHQLELTIQPDVATYPFLQVYTPPHRNSIAIENLSGTPDCFNNKMGLLELEPEKRYSFKTSYTIKIK